MTKTGVVKPGTPSCISGKPSHFVKQGEALRRGEKRPVTVESLAGKIPLEPVK